MPEFLSTNKALATAGVIIFSLIALVWGINNSRINTLEEWRRDQEAHAEVLLTKQRLYILTKQIDKLENEIRGLREQLSTHDRTMKNR